MISTLLLTGVIALSGCSKATEIKESELNELLSADTSFEDVVDSISNSSNIDEWLNYLDYKSDLDEYETYRKAGNINGCSDCLDKLGKKVLSTSICDLLGIPLDNLTDFELVSKDGVKAKVKYKEYDNKVVPGDIEVSNVKDIEKSYLLTGEAEDIGLAVLSAQNREIWGIDFIDKFYKSLERYLLTKGDYNSFFESLDFSYDDDKIEEFKQYKKVK